MPVANAKASREAAEKIVSEALESAKPLAGRSSIDIRCYESGVVDQVKLLLDELGYAVQKNGDCPDTITFIW